MGEDAERLQISDLAGELKRRRDTKALGLRAAAKEAGISFNTFARVEKGHVPDIETFIRLANWVGRSAADFLGEGSVTADSTPDAVEAHLRGDPALSDEAASRIAGIVREFYTQLAKPPEVATAFHLRAASTFNPKASELFADLLQQMHDALSPED
ncbi:MAG: helix-turn-helix transcriptional regulator [Deltaproteobacteria bacterium]|nr:helix-turn-helix transcriptional regulator [Deltaproteobacteria bacterium]